MMILPLFLGVALAFFFGFAAEEIRLKAIRLKIRRGRWPRVCSVLKKLRSRARLLDRLAWSFFALGLGATAALFECIDLFP